MEYEFKAAKLNGYLKYTSIGVTLFLIVVLSSITYYLVENEGTVNFIVIAIDWLVLIVIFITTYSFAPRSYKINSDTFTLIIKKNIGTSKFSLGNINQVKLGVKEDFRRSLRKFGIGGMFSNYGNFSNKILGSYKMYSTDMDNNVIIYSQNGIVVFSPQDKVKAYELLNGIKKK